MTTTTTDGNAHIATGASRRPLWLAASVISILVGYLTLMNADRIGHWYARDVAASCTFEHISSNRTFIQYDTIAIRELDELFLFWQDFNIIGAKYAKSEGAMETLTTTSVVTFTYVGPITFTVTSSMAGNCRSRAVQYHVLPVCTGEHQGEWRRRDDGLWQPLANECAIMNVTMADLRGRELLFLGNSHIRNLFRCFSDVISDGASHFKSKSPSRDRMSCENLSPVHGRDYEYWNRSADVRLINRWTVLWNSSLHEYNDPQSADRRYTGKHMGLYDLSWILPRLASNANATLVFNIYGDDTASGQRALTLVRDTLQRHHIPRHQVYWLVHPLRGTPPLSPVDLAATRRSMEIVDLKPHWDAYLESVDDGDDDDDAIHFGHLGPPLQRHLVRILFSRMVWQWRAVEVIRQRVAAAARGYS